MATREPREAFIKGIIVPGIFQNERGFIINISNRTLALYADQGDVVENPSRTQPNGKRPGELRASVMGTKSGLTQIVLPQETNIGEITLLVEPSDVEIMSDSKS